jgi:tRNA (guanine37-N1)-methyltransferase
LFEAVESIDPDRVGRVILTDPGGRPLDQSIVEELAKLDRMLLVCGSYEGYDERVREGLADDEISLGDFVLTNGALPAMVIVDAVTRLIPGVLGHAQSAVSESFNDELLDFPQYTRPAEFRGMRVPDVLLSGHHAEIENWRREQSLKRTLERRPDLFEKKKSDDQSGKSVN